MQDPIVITSMQTPVTDPRAGKTFMETIKSPTFIEEYLKNPERFTEEERFVSQELKEYSVKDLIGKAVKLDCCETFTV